MSVFVELPRAAFTDNALDGFMATADFKLDNARAMMWLSQLAYETANESKVDDILKGWKLTKLGFVTNNVLTGLPPHSAWSWLPRATAQRLSRSPAATRPSRRTG